MDSGSKISRFFSRFKYPIYLIAFSAFIGLGFYSYKATVEGFNLSPIQSSNPELEVSLSEEKQRDLQSLLSQPYIYIGHGNQSYVFKSKDGQTILKFPRHKRLLILKLKSLLPVPSLRTKCKSAITLIKKDEKKFYHCYKLSYECIPDLTDILYIHFNSTAVLQKPVQIVDQLGFTHFLDLNKYEFLVQKRAHLFEDLSFDEDSFLERIELILKLIEESAQKGIVVDDFYVHNIGFSPDGKRALFIDSGRCREVSSLTPTEKTIYMRNVLEKIQNYVADHRPQSLERISSFFAYHGEFFNSNVTLDKSSQATPQLQAQ